MKYYIIKYDENDKKKKVLMGVDGLIVRNKTESKNVYFDGAIELTKYEIKEIIDYLERIYSTYDDDGYIELDWTNEKNELSKKIKKILKVK